VSNLQISGDARFNGASSKTRLAVRTLVDRKSEPLYDITKLLMIPLNHPSNLPGNGARPGSGGNEHSTCDEHPANAGRWPLNNRD
jgi:hypothetical protein